MRQSMCMYVCEVARKRVHVCSMFPMQSTWNQNCGEHKSVSFLHSMSHRESPNTPVSMCMYSNEERLASGNKQHFINKRLILTTNICTGKLIKTERIEHRSWRNHTSCVNLHFIVREPTFFSKRKETNKMESMENNRLSKKRRLLIATKEDMCNNRVSTVTNLSPHKNTAVAAAVIS